MCGAISQYNATSPTPGPANLMMAVGKRLRMQGFIVSDHNDVQPEFIAEVAPWLDDGRLRHDEMVVDGVHNAAQAFIDMLDGANTGKMIVSLAPTT